MTVIGVIADFTTSYGRQTLWGIGRYCRQINPWTVNPLPLAAWDRIAHTKDFNGLIVQANEPAIAQAIVNWGVPSVNIADNFPNHPLPTVCSDHQQIGRLACEHFLNRGFKSLAYFGERAQWYAQQRGEGFLTLARRQKVQLSEFWGSFDGLPEQREARMRLRSLPRPVGVLACNDRWGWRLSLECQAAGLRIPEDVAIVGVDNDVIMCQLCQPPLSSVATPSVRIGYEAAALLDRLMKGQSPPTQPIVLQPNGVITRQSSDILAVDDDLIVEALAFIREHAAEPINVASVVQSLAVSRRRLEQRFRLVLGRTVAEEIRHVRIERARKLLSTTDVSLSAIALECGFSDAPRLTKVFRRETGTTPSEFRQRAQLPDQPI